MGTKKERTDVFEKTATFVIFFIQKAGNLNFFLKV